VEVAGATGSKGRCDDKQFTKCGGSAASASPSTLLPSPLPTITRVVFRESLDCTGKYTAAVYYTEGQCSFSKMQIIDDPATGLSVHSRMTATPTTITHQLFVDNTEADGSLSCATPSTTSVQYFPSDVCSVVTSGSRTYSVMWTSSRSARPAFVLDVDEDKSMNAAPAQRMTAGGAAAGIMAAAGAIMATRFV